MIEFRSTATPLILARRTIAVKGPMRTRPNPVSSIAAGAPLRGGRLCQPGIWAASGSPNRLTGFNDMLQASGAVLR